MDERDVCTENVSACLEGLVPLDSAGRGASDGLADGHGLRRGRGREELLEDFAVQVRLRGEIATPRTKTKKKNER